VPPAPIPLSRLLVVPLLQAVANKSALTQDESWGMAFILSLMSNPATWYQPSRIAHSTRSAAGFLARAQNLNDRSGRLRGIAGARRVMGGE
jgi:hypothetical protein